MTFMQNGDLAYALAGYGKKSNPYDSRRKFAYNLIQQGSDTSPVQSPWQGAARLAQALTGAFGLYMADKGEKESQSKLAEQLAAAGQIADPAERINAYTKIDPEHGMRGGIQLAVEQAKQQQQQAALKTGAANFGSAYGAPQGPQQATGMPSPLPTGQIAPGGFANNLGNIRATNINWEGKGAPHNGFETFGTPQAGAGAMFKNLGAYVQQNPGMTVAQAIAKWAPPNENDTNGYIKRLAEATGINPGMPLAEVLKDPAVAATLMDGITRIEKGGVPPGATADTFIAAAGGPAQAAPGVPGPVAGPQIAQAPMPPPQVAQGGGDGTPPPPNPAGVNGPSVIAPPGVPDVPRPQPSQQQIQQYQQRLMSGEFGQGPDAVSKARAAMDADLDRQWQVDRERRFKEFDQQSGDYRAQRERQDKQPQEAFSNEKALRNEFETQPAVKSYRVVVPMLESAKDAAARPTRAADLNLVYAFAKLMDPDSVVRESETAGVVATASVADRLQAYIGQLNGQAMLNPDTRAKLLAELDSRFVSLKASHDALAEQYGAIAQAHGLTPGRVVIPIRTGREGSQAQGNQPSQDELKRWSSGGQTGAPVRIGLDGRPR